MNGYSYEKGRDYCCYRWDSTLNALTYLRAGLQQAVQGDDNERTLRWCEAILRWGLGNRWRRPNQRLLEINQNPRFPGISRYLGHVSRHLVLESVTIGDITSDLIPYSCSGFAKNGDILPRKSMTVRSFSIQGFRQRSANRVNHFTSGKFTMRLFQKFSEFPRGVSSVPKGSSVDPNFSRPTQGVLSVDVSRQTSAYVDTFHNWN